MSDDYSLAQCKLKCPIDERERDAIWREIDSAKLMLSTLDKSQAIQQAELLRVSNRIETVHDHMIDRLDKIGDNLERLVKKVNSDSDELRRREGADANNRKWAKGVIAVLGTMLAMGWYIGFQPATASPIPNKQQTIERSIRE